MNLNRVIRVVLPPKAGEAGVCVRPAIVVDDVDAQVVNATVFFNGEADRGRCGEIDAALHFGNSVFHRVGLKHDATAREAWTWHWPPSPARADPPATKAEVEALSKRIGEVDSRVKSGFSIP